MSAQPVDVLAAIDSHIKHITIIKRLNAGEHGAPADGDYVCNVVRDDCANLQDAREAVHALLVTARRVEWARHHGTVSEYEDAVEAHSAALARCGVQS